MHAKYCVSLQAPFQASQLARVGLLFFCTGVYRHHLQRGLMRKEHSYGIIPLRFFEKQWHVLLIKHVQGHWSFPKGHPEKEETPKETAARELEEEVGLRIEKWIESPSLSENYVFTYKQEIIAKTVTYFLAEVTGVIKAQEEEIEEIRWLTLNEAKELATFDEAKRLCDQVSNFLKSFP